MRRGEGSWGSGEGGVGETSMGGGVEAAEEGGRLVALRGRGKEREDGVVGWLCGERTLKAAGLWDMMGSPTTSCCCSGLEWLSWTAGSGGGGWASSFLLLGLMGTVKVRLV